ASVLRGALFLPVRDCNGLACGGRGLGRRRLFGILSRVSVETHRMTGLARELSRAIRASPSPQEVVVSSHRITRWFDTWMPQALRQPPPDRPGWPRAGDRPVGRRGGGVRR